MGDMAIAIGPNTQAFVEGGFGDYASAFSPGPAGAIAGAGNDAGPGATGNDFDFASAVSFGSAKAIADAGDNANVADTDSDYDVAQAIGNLSVAGAGLNGSGDYASAIGDNVQSDAGDGIGSTAANFDSASAWGNLFIPTTSLPEAVAGGFMHLTGGSTDLAFIFDPFGTVGSEALA